MAYRHFEEFLIRLEQEDELVRVEDEVDIQDFRQLRDLPSEKAYLFENIKGSDFPIAIHTFASEKRMAWALGLESIEDLNTRLSRLLDMRMPNGIGSMMSRAGEIMGLLAKFNTGKVRDIPAQEVIIKENIDLLRLPSLLYKGERLPIGEAQVITSGGTYTSGIKVINPDTVRIFPPPVSSGQIAIVFGSDPALLWSFSVPLPAGFDRALLAGWLRNRPIPYTRGISVDLKIPADAEMVLEGTLHSDGYITITTITHRREAVLPIFPTFADNYWMRTASERLFLPLLRLFAGEIIDFHSSSGPLVVQVNQPTEKVFFAIWGSQLLTHESYIVMVDADVDIRNDQAVKEAIRQNADGVLDVLRVQRNYREWIGVDATRKDRTPTQPVPDIYYVKNIG